MNENIKWIAAAVAVVGLSIGAVVYFTSGKSGTDKPPVPAPVAAKPAEPEEPPVEHPLAAADANQALPALNDSDLPMQMELEDLIGQESVGRYLVSEDVIRHVVVTIDNLPNTKVAERLRPGQVSTFTIVRDGTRRRVRIVLGTRPGNPDAR